MTGSLYSGSVFFGTPSYDTFVVVDYCNAMLQCAVFLTHHGVKMEHYVHAGDYDLGHARCSIVDAFLETDATDLFFVDSDVGFDARCLPRILQSEELVVAGLVPKRDAKDEAVYHMNALTGVIKGALFQSLEAPTAFMRIKREAFSRLKKPYFKMGASETEIGEDIYFCRKWCATGEFIWIDPDINFTHRGHKAWTGNFFDHCVKTGLLIQNGGRPSEQALTDIIPPRANGYAHEQLSL